MNREHRRPLVAYFVVAAVSGLLVGQGLRQDTPLYEAVTPASGHATPTPSTHGNPDGAAQGVPGSSGAATAQPTLSVAKEVAAVTLLVPRHGPGSLGEEDVPDGARDGVGASAGDSAGLQARVGAGAQAGAGLAGQDAVRSDGPRPTHDADGETKSDVASPPAGSGQATPPTPGGPGKPSAPSKPDKPSSDGRTGKGSGAVGGTETMPHAESGSRTTRP